MNTNTNPWEIDEVPGVTSDLLARLPAATYDELWQLAQDRNPVLRAAAERAMAERNRLGSLRRYGCGHVTGGPEQ